MRAASLAAVFVVAKLLVLPASVGNPIVCFWQDALVALLYAALDRSLRRVPWAGWAAYGLLVLYAAVNVPIARVLSTPLTCPMLAATRGTIGDSITLYLNARNLLLIVSVLAAGAIFPLLFRRLSPRWGGGLAAGAGLLAAAGACGLGPIDSRGLHRNALAAVVSTAFPRLPSIRGEADWRRSPFEPSAAAELSRFRGAARGRNVLMIHLESTAAQYLGLYGADPDPMPTLTRMSREAITFEEAYTVYPESIKGLASILHSTWPAMDTAPELYQKLEAPSLAALLSAEGYRTGLFHSGRFGYLGMESLVRHRSYETLEDAGAIGGNRESSFGVDEAAAVRRILDWIDSGPPDRPFFATYLPIAGHHPYGSTENGPFPAEKEIGRYRNALFEGDRALKTLVEGLKSRGLYERTLVVVFGDHGEAFGQHDGNFAHTLFLYEENVRVPLLWVLPEAVAAPRRVRGPVSLIDVGPTLLDLLGLAPCPEYQGRSLLEGSPGMALFFADYSSPLLGLRDRRWKFIHDLDSGRSKLFDLESDPGEREDLAPASPEQVRAYRDHLKAWSSAQRERRTQGH
ncbi:MAG: sulfatase [Planctomycetes bacterium]|nr:sulfatase [Planctomycetota bacterium]